MLNAIMLIVPSVISPKIVTLSVITLNVAILNVVAPFNVTNIIVEIYDFDKLATFVNSTFYCEK